MATGPITQLSDIVEPTVFTGYVQQLTAEKARVITSGIVARDAAIDDMLAGAGLTFNVPSFRDLDNEEENVSGQDAADHFRHTSSAGDIQIGSPNTIQDSRPKKTQADTEVAVRLSRNQSWSAADLASVIAGADPMLSIANRVSFYWQRRLQAALIAIMRGVSADNGANDSGDYANDVVGASFTDGVTNFSAEAFLDTALTMGDSQEDVTGCAMHSVVYNRAQKNNLIDFIPDSEGRVVIPTFLGRQVIVDDGVPSGSSVIRADGTAGSGQMYETWLFGTGVVRLGVGTPDVPTEVAREAQAGNGGGQEILYNRQEYAMHPVGHAYTGGTTAKGGPANSELDDAASWNRVYPERKQIKFARLITREA